MHSQRAVAVIAGTAVASIVAGFVAGTQVVSPAASAARAEPPAAEPVTVPVERRVLESRVVTRGDTSFAGAVEVVIPTGDLDSAAVVTGRVPEIGATIEEGAVLLEVVGRPVIALRGPLPTYRTLRPGSRGPDVAQLEEVLGRLGLLSGSIDDQYDAATGEAVAELFRRTGYEPPTMSAALLAELGAARQAVSSAEQAAAVARAALAAASSGPPESERLAAAAAVHAAERAVQTARESGDAHEIAAAEDQLGIARAQQRELGAPRDTAAEQAAVSAANRDLAMSRRRLADLEATVGTPAPAAELVFLPTLPRRVDQVDVAHGAVLEGAAMVLSGAELVVTARVGHAERQLLTEGMAVQLGDPGSTQMAGSITTISRAPDDDAAFELRIAPQQLSPEEVDRFRGANVRVTIPVRSTDGEVLTVPLAALSAGPGGESRVEVDGGDGEGRLVTVEVGLTADGYAEIRPRGDQLEVGDLVVVGR